MCTHVLVCGKVDADGKLYTWGFGGSWFSGSGYLGHGSSNLEVSMCASSPHYTTPLCTSHITPPMYAMHVHPFVGDTTRGRVAAPGGCSGEESVSGRTSLRRAHHRRRGTRNTARYFRLHLCLWVRIVCGKCMCAGVCTCAPHYTRHANTRL